MLSGLFASKLHYQLEERYYTIHWFYAHAIIMAADEGIRARPRK